MQFRDLHAQYLHLKEEIDANIAEVIAGCKFISGPMVGELEKQLAAYVGRKYCVSCANGTDALELVLRAWGIGPGDAVFVPSFTFMSTAEVVSVVGARPYFVDIDLDTFNMSPESLEAVIGQVLAERRDVPRVIIPVDLFGLPADYSRIVPIASKYGLKILEDGAQGFGGAINGVQVCSYGKVSTTSFFPAKPLGCYGDGGAMFCDDDELRTLLSSLCVHGKGREKYENIRLGRNSRLDTLQAAILLPKLKAFIGYELDAVNRVADQYSAMLASHIKTPLVPAGFRSSWAQYTLLCESNEQRSHLQGQLKAADIPSMVYYPCGLHLQKVYAGYGYREGMLPNTEKACRCVLSLPMHPYLAAEDVERVCTVLKQNI